MKNFHDWFGTNDVKYMLMTTLIAFLSGFLPPLVFFLENFQGGPLTLEALISVICGATVAGSHIALKYLAAIVANKFAQITAKQPAAPEISVAKPDDQNG